MKRIERQADGMYHKNGVKYQMLTGSRAQVWHGTAIKTSGGLLKQNLMMNKHGRIVSKSKYTSAKKNNRLAKAGFLTKKGTFGFVKAITNKLKPKKKKQKTKKNKTK
jgi:hypothetical protein